MPDNTTLSERIEAKIDARELTLVSSGATAVSLMPQSMPEVMEFAKMMAISGPCVRPFMRDRPGICLSIALQAYRWGADPFAVSNKAYLVKNKSGDEQIAWEAGLVHAIVNSSGKLQRRLRGHYDGQGLKRRCFVGGLVKGETEELMYESPPIEQIEPRNSPLWKTDPDQQLWYYSVRAWARKYLPEVIEGIYVPDEMITIEHEPEPEPQRPPERKRAKRESVPPAERHALNTLQNESATPEPPPASPAPPEPVFAVVDLDGVEHLHPHPMPATAMLHSLLAEAEKLGGDRLDGVWESNTSLVEQLHAAGFAGQADSLAMAYADARQRINEAAAAKAAAIEAAKVNTPPPTAAATAPASATGSGAASAPDATASNPMYDRVRREEQGKEVVPDSADPGDNETAPSDEGGAAPQRPATMLIPMVLRQGKPDFRTWTMALFLPKLRRQRTEPDLGFLLGDNEENLLLVRAQGALSKDDRAELDRAIEHQWALVAAA